MNKQISKKLFWRFVNVKINRAVHHYHVFAVLSILFEEMVKDFDEGKEIKIFNLGKLALTPTKHKKYFDIRFQKTMVSTKNNRSLKFILQKNIKDKLSSLVSLDEGKESD